MARYREISTVFPFISGSKTCDPCGEAKFDLRGIENIWEEGKAGAEYFNKHIFFVFKMINVII